MPTRFEINGFRSDIPLEIRDLDPELYDYLRQLTENLRLFVTASVTGSLVLSENEITSRYLNQEYPLGSIARAQVGENVVDVRFYRIEHETDIAQPSRMVFAESTELVKLAGADTQFAGLDFTTIGSGKFGWIVTGGETQLLGFTPPARGKLVYLKNGVITDDKSGIQIGVSLGNVVQLRPVLALQDPQEIPVVDLGPLEARLAVLETQKTLTDEQFAALQEFITNLQDTVSRSIARLESSTQLAEINGVKTELAQMTLALGRMDLQIQSAIQINADNASGAQISATAAYESQIKSQTKADQSAQWAEVSLRTSQDAAISSADAATQATVAQTAAATATTEAASASSSASLSATYASNAATSAGNASTSATSASTSAADASASAASAAASASLAASYGGSGGNLLPNSEFNNGSAAGWGLYIPGAATVDNFGVNLPDSNWHPVFGNALAIRQSNIVGLAANSPAVLFTSDMIPVKAGETYQGFVYIAAHRATVYMQLEWFDKGQNFLSVAPSSWISAGTGGRELANYTQIGIKASTAPAGAALCKFVVVKSDTITGSDSWMWITRPYFGITTPGQTNFAPYSQSANAASLKEEQQVRAAADSALSSSVGSLSASISFNAAQISSEASARVSADSAIASNVSTLSSTVGGHTATLSTQAAAITDVQGRTSSYWKLNAVAGGRAQLKVWADSVGGGGVDIIGDVKINGNLLVTGSVNSPQLAANAVSHQAFSINFGDTGFPATTWYQTDSISLAVEAGYYVEFQVIIAVLNANYSNQWRLLIDGVEQYREYLEVPAAGASYDYHYRILNWVTTLSTATHTFSVEGFRNSGNMNFHTRRLSVTQIKR